MDTEQEEYLFELWMDFPEESYAADDPWRQTFIAMLEAHYEHVDIHRFNGELHITTGRCYRP